MNTLNKRIFRDLKSNWARYISVFFLIIIGIGMANGFLVVSNGIKNAQKEDQKKNNLEYALVQTNSTLEDNDIEQINELLYESNFKVVKNYYSDVEMTDEIKLRVFDERLEANIPTISVGKYPSNSQEVMLDSKFAEIQKIEIGDTIVLNNQDYIVSGLASFPDYVASKEKLSDLVADRNYFGVSMVLHTAYKNMFNQNKINNYSILQTDNLTNNQNIKDGEIKDVIREFSSILSYEKSSQNSRITGLTEKLDTYKSVAILFAVLITLILAFVFVMISLQMVNEESSIMGVLIASGIDKRKIVISYLMLPTLVTFIAALIGSILGNSILANVASKSIYSYFNTVDFIKDINITQNCLMTFFPTVLVLLVNSIFFLKRLSVLPIKLIRNANSNFKGRKHTTLPKKLKFITGFKIRIMQRSKGTFILLFVGVFLSGLLLMFGLGMSTTCDHYVDVLVGDITTPYQYSSMSMPEISKDNSAEKAISYEMKTYYEKKDKNLPVIVLGLDSNTKFYKSIELPLKDDQITISSTLAGKLDINKGDSITLYDNILDKEHTFEIFNVDETQIGMYAFLPINQLQNMIGQKDNYFNTYFSSEELNFEDDVTIITDDDIINAAKTMKTNLISLINMLTFVSFIVYILMIFLLTKMIIDKNKLNVSLLKLFGYEDKEVNGLYIKNSSIFVILSIIISLPLQNSILTWYWPNVISTMSSYFSFYASKWVFLIIPICGIIISLLVSFILKRNLRNIEISTVLKNRE